MKRPASDRIAVLIADDHPLFRRGVREVVEEDSRYEIVGEAGDGSTALRLIRDLLPAVALLDVEMPKMSGLDVARELRDAELPVSVIILTVHDEHAIFRKVREYGVMGYVLKDTASSDLHRAIESVLQGDCFISPGIAKYALSPGRTGRNSGLPLDALRVLTPAERTVLHLIARNMSTREIAETLHNSPRTIGNHRLSICQKLDLHGALALVRFALENRDAIDAV